MFKSSKCPVTISRSVPNSLSISYKEFKSLVTYLPSVFVRVYFSLISAGKSASSLVPRSMYIYAANA